MGDKKFGWDKWDELLGGDGETESSGATSEPDPLHGRKGTMIIRRRIKKNGLAIFELFLDKSSFAAKGKAPTGAEIVSLEIEGFPNPGCQGKPKVCAQHSFLPAGERLKPFEDPTLKPPQGTSFAFEPNDHDGGILSGMLENCSCAVKNVKSYKLYVTVKVTPAPVAPQDMRFSVCYECGVEE